MQFLFAKNAKKQCMAKRPVEPLGGRSPPFQFFDLEDFINEKFIKIQKGKNTVNTKSEGGMPKRKKFFGQKNHPKPLMFVEIL